MQFQPSQNSYDQFPLASSQAFKYQANSFVQHNHEEELYSNCFISRLESSKARF